MPKNNTKQSASKVAVLERRLTRLQHAMTGCQVRPGPDPTSVVISPVFSMTLTTGLTNVDTVTEVTISNLRTNVQDQLALATDDSFSIRIREVRVWGNVGGTLGCEFYDFERTNVAASLRDTATLSTRPRLGWVFPTHLATQWWGSNNATVFSYTNTETTAPANNGVYHVLVQVRFNSTVIP